MADRDRIGYGGQPPHPTWPGDARLALQFVLNVEDGAESSVINGDAESEAYLHELPGRAVRRANAAAAPCRPEHPSHFHQASISGGTNA